MKTITPNKLSPGDEIRIIAPSLSLSIVPKKARIQAQKKLESMGFIVTFGIQVLKKNVSNSSSITERLSDWNDAWKDKNVKAIWCATGGYNTNQLLPYINWDIVKKNPKIFCGYSDITVLLNAINANTGLITYHAPNFQTLSHANNFEYVSTYLTKALVNTDSFCMDSSPTWAEDGEEKQQKNNGLWMIQPGNTRGRSFGGNLCSINLLQGTPYMPDLKDTIVFIEDDPLLYDFPLEFDRNLQSLLQQKNGDKLKGIVIGRFQRKCLMTKQTITNIIANTKSLRNIPVIANADFGHTGPRCTFPIGAKVSIQATKNKCSITFV